MEKISGIVYERGKSFNFGMIAFVCGFFALIPFLFIQQFSASVNDWWIIVVFAVICLIFAILSIVNLSRNIDLDFIIDGKLLTIQLYKGWDFERIEAQGYKFSIISGRSNYSNMGYRILVELEIKTNQGSFSIVENLVDGSNPGFPIRPETGFFVERFFVRSQGTLLELAKKMGQLSQ